MGLLTPYSIIASEWTPKLSELRDRIHSGLGKLGAGIPAPFLKELAKTLEVVNSYASNSMEGNPTHIGDIFGAQEGRLATTTVERNYQLEHLAHIKTTEKMRQRLQEDSCFSPSDVGFLQFLHREFYQALPESMRFATLASGRTIPIVPGEFRDLQASVGHHQVVPVEQLKLCMEEFEHAYQSKAYSDQDALSVLAAAHHRFLWIHPFADGNGRVVRLMTEAMAIRMRYEGHHLYSISRGLARRRGEYDAKLSAADAPRWNDLDGRGSLSLKGLAEFTEFFLDVVADQMEFMTTLMDMTQLTHRWNRYLKVLKMEGKLSGSECVILLHLLRVGEMRRGEIQNVAGVERRQASKIAGHLLKLEYVHSPSDKGPLRLKANREIVRALFQEFF